MTPLPLPRGPLSSTLNKPTLSLTLALGLILAISHVANANHDGSDDPLDWLRDSIPGEPGVDYPVYNEIQDTGFTCKDKIFGGNSNFIFSKI